ncbi:MAG: KOW domain-containing RNA-binding protein [Christensenellaceae bacterium]|jgi:ribosomal protein L14E/L6E/L27E|nr:KOW domain-containing RNA-binding protein [Christensenellaceae bacterium]
MPGSLEIGAIVFSKSGRDSGRYYVIVEIVDDQFVKIVDGKFRRLDKPKLKKIKHLKLTNDCLKKIADKIRANKKIFDAEINSALRNYNGSI